MENIFKEPLITKVKGIYTLTRFLPTISWGISAAMVGLAFALKGPLITGRAWLYLVLVIVNIILIHGVASHAINDLIDWQSGTDRLSPGNYSGGSKVIKRNLLTGGQLKKIAVTTLALGVLIAAYLTVIYGYIILAFLFIALWAAIAYTYPPFMLSYKPLLGEWLAGFPAVASVSVLTYFVLRGGVTYEVIWAGIIQGIFAIGLLMFHHISDVTSDLQADPPKITTVAFIAKRYGQEKCGLVAALYFLLIIPAGIIGMALNPVFILSVLFAIPGLIIALQVNPLSIKDITAKETVIFALVIGHSIAYFVALTMAFTKF